MRTLTLSCTSLLFAGLIAGHGDAQSLPYDFSAADTLLQNELSQLNGHVAVIVRQGNHELYRFQAGDIDYGTKTRLASLSKTISAGVILSLVDAGTLLIDQRLGDTLPGFTIPGMGEATIADCWGMRHGFNTLVPYEANTNFNLAQSVGLIGLFGFQQFRPGEMLGYDGSGM
jgi:CubicO group peptidase (beta-lactamase class C family)